MKEGKVKNILRALILIILAPYIGYLVCKKHYIITLVTFFSIIIVFTFALVNKKVDLNIIDVQSAFNRGFKRNETKYIVIHHTAGDTSAVVNDIVKIHFKERQWDGIGYHFFISANGIVYQLRGIDEAKVPHALGFNDNSIAICISGNFSENECPELQWEIALELVRGLMEKYGLTSDDVKGHRELPNNPEECPGILFDMKKFREDL